MPADLHPVLARVYAARVQDASAISLTWDALPSFMQYMMPPVGETPHQPPKIPPNPGTPLEAQHLAWKRRYYGGGKFSLNPSSAKYSSHLRVIFEYGQKDVFRPFFRAIISGRNQRSRSEVYRTVK